MPDFEYGAWFYQSVEILSFLICGCKYNIFEVLCFKIRI